MLVMSRSTKDVMMVRTRYKINARKKIMVHFESNP